MDPQAYMPGPEDKRRQLDARCCLYRCAESGQELVGRSWGFGLKVRDVNAMCPDNVFVDLKGLFLG